MRPNRPAEPPTGTPAAHAAAMHDATTPEDRRAQWEAVTPMHLVYPEAPEEETP